jgi:PAS domain S-box-containing protein
MLTVIGCFIIEHDPWLLTLAAIICALASTSTIALLHHAKQTRVGWRNGWVAVAAVAGGSGIWATHFLGMLATDPGLIPSYAVGLTVLSLVFAIVVSGLGLAIAVFWRARSAALAGGAVVGLGIAAMHYTGMAAYQVAGRMVWNPALVALSVAVGVGLAMAALWIGLSSRRARGRVVGAALLAGAIGSHHTLGMMALSMVPDPSVIVPEETVPALWLALPVGLASLTILIMACTTLVLDLRDRQREVYRGRLLSLANAAVEGLVICQDGVIVSANDSFADLAGGEAKALAGLPLAQFVPDSATRTSLADNPNDVVEGTLYRLDGSDLPVELIMRPVAYGRTPHVALAVRDLTTRRRAERQIRFLVGHDLLTGLPNRRHFQDCLDRDIRQAGSGRLALLHINLDGFKEINDLFGNPIGDATLVRVAHLISSAASSTRPRRWRGSAATSSPC